MFFGEMDLMKHITLMFLMVFMLACSNSDDKSGSKWRLLSKEEYSPNINSGKIANSLDELEKLIFAPMFYFEKESSVKSFSQNFSVTTASKNKDKKTGRMVARKLDHVEEVLYSRDLKNNFKISYVNNQHEGLDMIWKDGFLYKKMLGGEYVRAVSWGEHTYLKESYFKMIPEIYSMFRENAEIFGSKDIMVNDKACRNITVRFGDKKIERIALAKRKYLQNSFGIEEMKNDKLVTIFRGKKKNEISGELNLCVSGKNRVVKLDLNLSFLLEEGVQFIISGQRELSEKAIYDVVIPEFNKEYHRRVIDAAKNIMKD